MDAFGLGRTRSRDSSVVGNEASGYGTPYVFLIHGIQVSWLVCRPAATFCNVQICRFRGLTNLALNTRKPHWLVLEVFQPYIPARSFDPASTDH